MQIDKRFVFSGHAIGATAHFHRLDDVYNLDHRIPTLGSSALPQTGGLSHHHVSNFSYTVKEPKRRTLLSAKHAETIARGTERDDHYETEVELQVRDLSIVDMLQVDLVELKQRAIRAKDSKTSLIRTTEATIEGLHLGNVTARVELDLEPFNTCCTRQELLDFLGRQDDDYRKENASRFTEIDGRIYATLVKKIDLEGPQNELAEIQVDENMITWNGFGKIFLGEVLIRDEDRRVTMFRLKMGSSAAGSGTIGCGHTNGGTVP